MELKMVLSIGWLRTLGLPRGVTKAMSRLLEVTRQMIREFAESQCRHRSQLFKSTF
jgi:hypothetical protein